MNIFIVYEENVVDTLIAKIKAALSETTIESCPMSMRLFNPEITAKLQNEYVVVIIDTGKQCCRTLLAHHVACLTKGENPRNKTVAILNNKHDLPQFAITEEIDEHICIDPENHDEIIAYIKQQLA